jgi:hypothetical protein
VTASNNNNRLIKPPAYVKADHFERVIIAATAAVSYLHRIPLLEEICNYTDLPPKIVSTVLASVQFKEVMLQRGYDFSNTAKLSPEQVWAVSIITNPTNRRSLKDKLSQAGITYYQYKAWLNQPHFSRYVKEIGERLLDDHVQDVHTRVVERATNGDIAAMRLYYDLTGRTDSSTNKAVSDLSATVRLLLEVITRNVTDAATLDKIQTEIAAVTDGRGTGNSINDFEFENIVQGEVVEIQPEPEPKAVVTESESIGEKWSQPELDLPVKTVRKSPPIRSI